LDSHDARMGITYINAFPASQQGNIFFHLLGRIQ
jgi:hypothetical protein